MADASTISLSLKPTLNGSGEEFAASQALKRQQFHDNRQGQRADFHKKQQAAPVQFHAASDAAVSDFNRQQKKTAQARSQWPTSAGAALKESIENPPYSRSGFKRGLIISKEYGRNIGGNVKRVFGQAKEEAESAATKGMGMGTSYLLKQCWLNIIDSYGLTLIWINIHVFCRFVFGEQYFCKLGQEWTSGGKGGGALIAGKGDKMVGGVLHSADGSKVTMGSGSGGSGGGETIFGMPIGGIGLAEAALLGLLDLIVLIAIFISLAPYILLAFAIADPAATLKTSLSVFYELAKTTVGQ